MWSIVDSDWLRMSVQSECALRAADLPGLGFPPQGTQHG